MATKVKSKSNKSSANLSDSKTFALIGALLGIIGFVIVLVAKKDDDYAMFYAKQSLILFIGSLIGMVISMVLAIVLIGVLIGLLVQLATVILWIVNIINSLSGEKKYLPYIGKYADKINL